VAAATRGAAYGFDATVEVDFGQVMERVRRVVEEVASQESPERLRAEGIELLAGDARFLDDHTVDVNGRRVVADRLVIATGSRPSVPTVEGLDAIGPLTNESVFQLRELPKRLLVFGGGAVGVELAQAFARLGAEVVLLEALPRSWNPRSRRHPPRSPRRWPPTGSRFGPGWRCAAPRPVPSWSWPTASASAAPTCWSRPGEPPTPPGWAWSWPAWRRPPTARWWWTAGCGPAGPTSTRSATAPPPCGSPTWLAVANALGRRARRFDPAAVPWVVFTDPEVGRVGMTEAQAFQAYGERAGVAWLPLADTDRARCAGQTNGFVKLLAAPGRLLGGTGGGRLVGMTAVGPAGGELVAEGRPGAADPRVRRPARPDRPRLPDLVDGHPAGGWPIVSRRRRHHGASHAPTRAGR
jgi:hypothetical protein